jgi:hypothetical protein
MPNQEAVCFHVAIPSEYRSDGSMSAVDRGWCGVVFVAAGYRIRSAFQWVYFATLFAVANELRFMLTVVLVLSRESR